MLEAQVKQDTLRFVKSQSGDGREDVNEGIRMIDLAISC